MSKKEVKYSVEPRPGWEVFFNEGRNISIAELPEDDDRNIVTVCPSDVDDLIEALKSVKAKFDAGEYEEEPQLNEPA